MALCWRMSKKKIPPRDEPMGEGFTQLDLLKFCALAGVHFFVPPRLGAEKGVRLLRRWPISPSALRLCG